MVVPVELAAKSPRLLPAGEMPGEPTTHRVEPGVKGHHQATSTVTTKPGRTRFLRVQRQAPVPEGIALATGFGYGPNPRGASRRDALQ